MAINVNDVTIVTLRTRPIKFRDPIDNSIQDGYEIESLANVRFNDGSEGIITFLPKPGDLAQGFASVDTVDQAATVFRFEPAAPPFDGSNPPNEKRSVTL